MSNNDERTVARISKIFLSEMDVFQKEYDEYEDGYNYLGGNQYKPEIKEWWISQRRPTRAFNLVFPMFNRVLGDFLLNQSPLKPYALPGGTAQIAQVIGQLIENSDEENEARSVRAVWALAGLIKRGFAYTRYSDERHLDGSEVFSVLDEFEVMFDSRAKDYYLDDAEYIIRSRWLTPEQILAAWPEHKSKLKPLMRDRNTPEFWNSISTDTAQIMDNVHYSNEREGKYRVIEFHEMDRRTAEVAFDTRTGNAEIWSLEGKKADIYLRTHPDTKIITRHNQKIKRIINVVPGFNYLLDEKDADIQDGTFDIVPFSAYTYSKRVIDNFGIMRNAKEPQDSFNEWLNESENAVKKASDPGYTMDESKIKNAKEVKQFGRMPGLNILVEEDADINSAIKVNDIGQMPFAAENKVQEKFEFLQKITGITSNMQGRNESKQANASLFAMQVKQSAAALETMYSNWNRSNKRIYNKRIRVMQENYSNERYFLINAKNADTGAVEQQELIINQRIGEMVLNDITLGRYSVIMDTSDRTPMAKTIRFMQKTEIVKMIAEMYGPQAIDPEWWLGESDLGDINKLIARINATLMGQAEQAEQAEAFDITSGLQDLAKKQYEFENADTSKQLEPAEKYK